MLKYANYVIGSYPSLKAFSEKLTEILIHIGFAKYANYVIGSHPSLKAFSEKLTDIPFHFYRI